MKILTDVVLRAHWFKTYDNEYAVDENTILTPAAKDFVKEHDIRLVCRNKPCAHRARAAADADAVPAVSCVAGTDDGYKTMTVTPIKRGSDGSPVYINDATGEAMTAKPEYMTHLYGNHLVPKTNPRIALRGQLDRLEAYIMQVQVLARRKKAENLVGHLSEILDFVRMLMRAEVLDKPVSEVHLLGMDGEQLRYESHHVREIYGISHPSPEYTMGALCMALNRLRTEVRGAELSAAKAFCDGGGCIRPDIVEALNRLSSCIYILFLRELTGKCGDGGGLGDAQKDPACRKRASSLPKKRSDRAILVEASGRHVHLTQKALETLFGKGSLTKKSDLSQPGQYAAKERVTLMTSKGELERVAVLGPVRDEVQVEISLTDAKILGLSVPVNLSGDLTGAADVIIAGPAGIYNAVGSVIAAKAHIHMTPEDAVDFGVEDKDIVAVRLESERPVTIEEVVVRVSDKFSLAMHLDYDEANAARFKKGGTGYMIRR